MFKRKFKPHKFEQSLYDNYAATDALLNAGEKGLLDDTEHSIFVQSMKYLDMKWAKEGEP